MKDKIAASAQVVLENISEEIKVREDELKQLNTTKAALSELYGIEAPAEVETTLLPEKAGKRTYKKRAAKNGGGQKPSAPALDVRGTGKVKPSAPARSTEAILADKPDTLGGAMKQIARQLKTFTAAQLIEQVAADKDFNALLEAASDTTLYGNLAYWSKTGKLTKTGEGKAATYSVVNL